MRSFTSLAALFLILPVTQPLSAIAQSQGVSLDIIAHVQSFGDMEGVANRWVGTRGRGLRLEGFSIQSNSSCLGLSYSAHIADQGDTGWFDEGTFIGSRGQERAVEGLAIRASGPCASQYNVNYKCHIEGTGDSSWLKNGQYCGTRGKAKRLEAFVVSITPR